MGTGFDALSTTADVLSGIDLSGKRVLVTGVSSGIGVETARSLAACGADVIGCARDLAKAKEATVGFFADAARAGGSFELAELDLADLGSVRACTDALLTRGDPFDSVICNAGIMAPPFELTKDGFESQFGTNHLGHFVLVNRITPLLRDGARVVVLGSSGHRFSDIDLADPNFDRTAYDPYTAYGRSKTANILFTVGFDRRHRHRGIRAVAVNPGGIRTSLTRYLDESKVQALVDKMNQDLVARGKQPFEHKTIAQGAATSVWAAVVAAAELVGGRYCEDCHVSEIVPADQPINSVIGGIRAYALDQDSAEALWAKSEAMVGEFFGGELPT
jgi:NAD(P)-dependent dehydrogenase (short-subunit alcohol dehydrogenase family)